MLAFIYWQRGVEQAQGKRIDVCVRLSPRERPLGFLNRCCREKLRPLDTDRIDLLENVNLIPRLREAYLEIDTPILIAKKSGSDSKNR